MHCRKSGIEGRVNVNGAERKFKTFRKQSAYITQQDHLLSNLSVEEYTMSAAHLKLGNDVSEKEKKLTVSVCNFPLYFDFRHFTLVSWQIELIMNTLGLTNSQSTRVSCLSGGECKRLAIGLELIDNPAILFLDEPTR